MRFDKFQDAEMELAADARLELELELSRQRGGHDVLLFEALSEEALRRTHRRLFEDAAKIIST